MEGRKATNWIWINLNDPIRHEKHSPRLPGPIPGQAGASYCENSTDCARQFLAKGRKCGGAALLSLQGRAGVLQFKTLSLHHFSAVKETRGWGHAGGAACV